MKKKTDNQGPVASLQAENDQPPKACNLAAIDVGSNAARLLIKRVETEVDGQRHVSKLMFLRVPLRLGMDVFGNGEISEERTKEFVAMMKACRQLMKVYHVSQYRACATSAMREARNGVDVLRRIASKAHLQLDIITGDEESRIIYDNHLSWTLANLADKLASCFLYVDVGGGSTEITFIQDGERVYSHSFNVGTIRMLKGQVKAGELEAMKAEVARLAHGHASVDIIGSGGNINKLYRMASKKRKMDYLPVVTLREQLATLTPLTVEERMETYGLKRDRADVIVPAAQIFTLISDCAKAKRIIVPNMGLADGMINEMIIGLK